MNTSEVLKIVDHTLLTQTATWEDIKTILDIHHINRADIDGAIIKSCSANA